MPRRSGSAGPAQTAAGAPSTSASRVRAAVHDRGDLAGTWIADTWQTGDRVGEIETLAVAPAYRGQGIGTRLLDGLTRELAAAGVTDLVLGALPGNTDAIRLYERHGFRPAWTYLARFPGR